MYNALFYILRFIYFYCHAIVRTILTSILAVAAYPSAKAGFVQSPFMPSVPDESLPPSLHSPSPPPSPPPPISSLPTSSTSDRLAARASPSPVMYNREASAVRGRVAESSPLSSSALHSQQHPRHGQSLPKSPDVLDHDNKRPSNSYTHHRQTSIVHGVQHSRNPSFAASPTTSTPLSSELIASFGRTGNVDLDSLQSSGRLGQQPDGQSNVYRQVPADAGTGHGMHATLGTIEDQDVDGSTGESPAMSLHRRMNSGGRPRTEHSHGRSLSRHHYTDSKSVGEYALHHLFNSVSSLDFPASFRGLAG